MFHTVEGLTKKQGEWLLKFNRGYYRASFKAFKELSDEGSKAKELYKEAVQRKNRKQTSDMWSNWIRVASLDLDGEVSWTPIPEKEVEGLFFNQISLENIYTNRYVDPETLVLFEEKYGSR